MNVKEAYRQWAKQYDTNENKTRDLEEVSMKELLKDIEFENCLELGCGTGKNTEWLVTKGKNIIAVDFSEEMLDIAREKIKSDNVVFIEADLNRDWNFADAQFDLVVCSLTLEHIENIERIFRLASNLMTENGIFYIGELHPFKQYMGSKAKFETGDGTQFVNAYTHHLSEYTESALSNGFEIMEIREYFDDNNRSGTPRILALKLRKIQ